MKKNTILTENKLRFSRSPYPWFLVKDVLFVAMVAFLSNVSLVSAGVSVNTGDVQPKNITANEGDQSVAVSTPVNEQAATSNNDLASLNAGVTSVDVTASAEGLQANNINEGSEFGGLFATANEPIEPIMPSDHHSTQLMMGGVPIAVANMVASRANYNEDHSYVVGYQTNKQGKNVVIVGPWSQALDNDAIAIGKLSKAQGVGSIAIGSGVTTDNGSTAYSYAFGTNSIALGVLTQAMRDNAVAIGTNTMARGNHSLAVGGKSVAMADEASALGYRAVAVTSTSVALGSNSFSDKAAGIAGFSPLLKGAATNTGFAWKSTLSAVSVGNVPNGKTRQITGVAAGTELFDAANVAQLKSLQIYVDKGWKLSAGGANATAVSIDNTVDLAAGNDNLKITKGNQDNKVKFDLAQDITLNSVKAGSNTFNANGLVISNGPQITTAGINAGNKKITGLEKGIEGTDAVNKAQLDESLNNISKKVDFTSSFAILYDKNSDYNSSVNYNSVTLGKKDSGPVALHNVKDGEISQQSHDAINGRQINKISQDVAKYFGGGAAFNNGVFTEPYYKLSKVSKEGKVENTLFNNVGEAFTGLDTNIKNVNDRIKDISQGVAQDSLLWDEAEGAFIAKHGRGALKTNSKIKNVEDGLLSAGSTEAVNGSQLYFVSNVLSSYLGGGAGYKDGKLITPTFKIAQFNVDGSGGNEKSYSNVASAFTGINTSFTNLNQEIIDVKNSILVTQDEGINLFQIVSGGRLRLNKKMGVVSIGKGTGGTEISILNNDSAKRIISGVEAGRLSEDSTDAVNGAQLYSIGKTVATYFGGSAGYNEKGEWSAPSFKIKSFKNDGSVVEASHNSVAAAFEDVGASFTNIKNEIKKDITNVITNVKDDSLVKWDEVTKLIKIGSEKGGDKITLANSQEEART
ncbi:hypothetical protein MCQ_00002, partial [Candidatus Bartonella washoeensis Sb944nv]